MYLPGRMLVKPTACRAQDTSDTAAVSSGFQLVRHGRWPSERRSGGQGCRRGGPLTARIPSRGSPSCHASIGRMGLAHNCVRVAAHATDPVRRVLPGTRLRTSLVAGKFLKALRFPLPCVNGQLKLTHFGQLKLTHPGVVSRPSPRESSHLHLLHLWVTGRGQLDPPGHSSPPPRHAPGGHAAAARGHRGPHRSSPPSPGETAPATRAPGPRVTITSAC